MCVPPALMPQLCSSVDQLSLGIEPKSVIRHGCSVPCGRNGSRLFENHNVSKRHVYLEFVVLLAI